jgi:hypothetical protein
VVVQQDAGDQVRVAGDRRGARGLVRRRPGGEVGEQPQFAAHHLVQHALVARGAAGRAGAGG